ncbi:MAG: PEP-utilizing enzyme, partial [Patescibacteria group bacterium]
MEDSSPNWILYFSRPHTLFTATLWQRWYESVETKKILDVLMPDALLEEGPVGQVSYFVKTEQFSGFKNRFKELLEADSARCFSALRTAEQYNKEATEYVEGKKKFLDLNDATDFLVRLAIYSAGFPYFLPLANKELSNDPEIDKMSEELRRVSLYPQVLLNVIVPMAKEKIIALGGSSEDLDLITFQELLAGDLSVVASRRRERGPGKLFTYKVLNGKRTVEWQDVETSAVSTNEQISGAVAYPGKVRGRARLVFSFDGKGVNFNEGDILVAPHTSPNLLAIIKKSSAVITDEGGITSHAAIIARELKKPCIIGTKIA